VRSTGRSYLHLQVKTLHEIKTETEHKVETMTVHETKIYPTTVTEHQV
jgi:hypothetical protein